VEAGGINARDIMTKVAWYGVGAPKNTPREIVDKLNQNINAALGDAEVQARFTELGATVFKSSPAEFGAFIAADTEKWAKVIQFSGTKAD
jgi:tripartite-type tricarboxylate transporter receptor subunit TctC